MNQVLSYKKLFFYYLVIIFFIIFFDITYGKFVNYYIYNTKNLEINLINKKKPNNIILGSSTAKYSINPYFFDEPTYNASKNGEGLMYASIILDNILNKEDIDMILIGIDPIDLSLEYNDKKTLNNLLKIFF